MPTTRRCVFGCKTTGVAIHNFPQPTKDPDRFKIWVKLAGPFLSGMTDDEIYNRKKVCDIHFRPQDKTRNNRLSSIAVPSLLVPGTATVDIASHQTCHDMPSTSTPDSSTSSKSTVLWPGIATVVNASHQSCHDMPSISTPDSSTSSKSTVLRPGIATVVSASHQIYTDMPSTPDIGMSSKSTVLQPGPTSKPRLSTFVTKTTQRQIKDLKRQILRLKKKGEFYKTRLENAEKLSNSKAFKIVTGKMNLPAKLFTRMQYWEALKKPKGRRFAMDEKILSLSLFKRSPKCYKLLSKCFTLPSARSLKKLLAKIKIRPGINKAILEKIKDSVASMSEDDKLCVLIFDEMYITPYIQYDAGSDQLKGFTSLKDRDEHQIADHVLTFMVRGIKKNYKQPVAYYFTQSMNKIELKSIIKNIITEVYATGLKILATVCDQSAINVGAIDGLINDSKEQILRKGKIWKHDCIILNNKKIIPLYDVPHLLKGLRNNLLTKNLIYRSAKEDKEKVLKWEYFEELYQADKSYDELKILQKITEEHLIIEKINKMKVKTAAQVFSHSVAVAVKHLSESGKVRPEVTNIEEFVLIIDKLFDSLNCNTFDVLNGKIYRAGVKKGSPHHQLWIDAIKFLKNMKFLEQKKTGDKIRVVEKTVPSIRNFIKTIEGMQAIWKMLSKNHGLDTMLCRNFNQDPIENFFGNIRSLGARNVAPNSVGFEGAYKALLINNFSSSHSIKANCEEDIATFLQSLNFFLDQKEPEKSDRRDENELPLRIPISNQLINNDAEIHEAGQGIRNYVCGWVLKKCLTRICKSCKTCRQELLTNEISGLIKDKEYVEGKKLLVYPSKKICTYFANIQKNTTDCLKNNIGTENTKLNIKVINEFLIEDFNLKCKKHNIAFKKYFEDIVINIMIYGWCRSINRILSGKIVYDGEDEVKSAAQLYYNKHKHNKVKK